MKTEVISKFYSSDFGADSLQLQVTMFHDLMNHKHSCVHTFGLQVDILKSDDSKRYHLPELTKTVRIILTVPVTDMCDMYGGQVILWTKEI